MKSTPLPNEALARMRDKRAIDPLDLLTGFADNALYDVFAAGIADELVAAGKTELAQVFLLEWDGCTDVEIGERLGICAKTVRKRKKLVLSHLEGRNAKGN